MQNDMRDRLVELLNQRQDNGNCETIEEKSITLEFVSNEKLADHLIANGVIVPPCKVGDKVYEVVITKKGGYINEHTIVGFHLGEFPDLRGQTRKQYLIGHCEVMNFIFHLDMKKIGERLFFNRDQAEQKLKEMRVENG